METTVFHSANIIDCTGKDPYHGTVVVEGERIQAVGPADQVTTPRDATRIYLFPSATLIMSTPFEAGIEAEVAQGTAIAGAAKKAGVGHLVYSSVASADRITGVPHFDSKFRVEEYIKDLAIPYTVVAPVYFFDNVISPFMLPGIKRGSLAVALPKDLKIQQIPVRDIAAFAVLAIDRRDEFFGKRVDIASDGLTGRDTAAILSGVLGRKIEYTELPLEQAYAVSEDLGKMMDWLARVGYNADITGLRRDYPEIGWHSFEEWAKDHDWSALDQP